MMRQRAGLLVVALIGVGVGLVLPRAWPGLAPAEAAQRVTWRCISPFEGGITAAVHNPGSTPFTASIASFQAHGEENFSGDLTVLPGGSEDTSGGPQGATLVVRGPSRMLVDAYRDTGSGLVQIACYKGG
jgi:hypothetical protein